MKNTWYFLLVILIKVSYLTSNKKRIINEKICQDDHGLVK